MRWRIDRESLRTHIEVKPRLAVRIAALLVVIAASSCTSMAERIAEPNGRAMLGADDLATIERGWGIESGRVVTPAGIGIAYVHVPAAERAFEYHLSTSGNRRTAEFKSHGKPRPLPVHGTVIYLHGWGMDSSSLLPWALALSEQGYQGYALDLRNFGRSDRAPAGYGPREAEDVVAVARYLNARGTLPPPVYLFGVSLGASTALFAESKLHGLLAGIVALEPFANAADAIQGTINAMRDRHDDNSAAIREAGDRLGLDLTRVDLAPVVTRSRTCTLLLHGTKDTWIDPGASRALAALSPRFRFKAIPGEGHLGLPARVGWLAAPIVSWMSNATSGRCPEFTTPRDPLLAVATDGT